jgi:hypothetical protein
MGLRLAGSKNSRLHTSFGLPVTDVSPKPPVCSILVDFDLFIDKKPVEDALFWK